MSDKAKRARIQIAGIEVEVFQLPDGEYVMSQSQVASAVGVNRTLMFRFLDEQWLEGNLHKDYRCYKIDFDSTSGNRGGNGQIKPVAINLASEFWLEQAIKGNVKAQGLAQACIKEALERRCDKAFEVTRTDEERDERAVDTRETWEKTRGFLKDAHASFTNCCIANTFMASVAHDKITLAVCGKTARELREMDVIDGMDTRVGLNHIKDIEQMRQVARVKLEFSRYRTGNVDQRIDRAMEVVTGIKVRRKKVSTS